MEMQNQNPASSVAPADHAQAKFELSVPTGSTCATASSSTVVLSSDSDNDRHHDSKHLSQLGLRRSTRRHRPLQQLSRPLHLIYISSDSEDEKIVTPLSSYVSEKLKESFETTPTINLNDVVKTFATVTIESNNRHGMVTEVSKSLATSFGSVVPKSVPKFQPPITPPPVVQECSPYAVEKGVAIHGNVIDTLPSVQESSECIEVNFPAASASCTIETLTQMPSALHVEPIVDPVEEKTEQPIVDPVEEKTEQPIVEPIKEKRTITSYVYNTRSRAKQDLSEP